MDSALVCTSWDNLQEAIDDLDSWPIDHTVVDDDMEIVAYHPDWAEHVAQHTGRSTGELWE